MDSELLIDIFGKIFATYNLILIIAAVILNPMIFYTCIKSKKLRSTSTFKMLAFGSINDLLCSLPWNQECFGITFFNYVAYNESLFYCRSISVFLQFVTFEYASWSLVSISLDRFLSMTFKQWSKSYFGGKKPVIFCSVLAFLIAAINFNQVFMGGYNYYENGTEIIVCFSNPPGEFPWYNTMSLILVYIGYILPYGLITLFNVLIIFKATRFERVHNGTSSFNSSTKSKGTSSKRKAEMTRTILIITFLYIATSITSTVITAYFFNDIVVLKSGQMIINLVDGILFTFPSFNFFILFFSNKLFAREFKSLLLRQNVITSDTRTNKSTTLQNQN